MILEVEDPEDDDDDQNIEQDSVVPHAEELLLDNKWLSKYNKTGSRQCTQAVWYIC